MVEPVQRWRIAFRRGSPALDLGPSEIAQAWESALTAAGIPVLMSAAARPRPRLTFAAPLPPGRAAEHDLTDVVLGERWSLSRTRAALEAALPAGFEIVDMYDVWVGPPTITAALNAMSHRATVRGAPADELAAAVRVLLDSVSLLRTRAKGAERQTSYDLRPLILELEVVGAVATETPAAETPAAEAPAADTPAGDPAAVVRMVLDASSDGPSGRPDEVILALGEAAGHELELVELVRERLWTRDEVPTLAR
jgi:radical SAM-linked protein